MMNSFNSDDLTEGHREVEIGKDTLSVQRSLEINLNLKTDSFFFVATLDHKPYTCKVILSMINGILDPQC